VWRFLTVEWRNCGTDGNNVFPKLIVPESISYIRPLIRVSAAWVFLLILSLGLSSSVSAQDSSPGGLQVHIIDGEGAAYALGSRATRGVTVQITDEIGRAVDGATVSFMLPAVDPAGPSAPDPELKS
jgi:hypothetical protein